MSDSGSHGPSVLLLLQLFFEMLLKSRQRLYINRWDMNYTDLDKEKIMYVYVYIIFLFPTQINMIQGFHYFFHAPGGKGNVGGAGGGGGVTCFPYHSCTKCRLGISGKSSPLLLMTLP